MTTIYILYFIGVIISLIIFGYINAESMLDDFGLLWILLAFIWPIVLAFTIFILVCGSFYYLGFLIKREISKELKHFN